MKISFPPKSVSLSPNNLACKKAVDASQHSIGQPTCEAIDNAIFNEGYPGVIDAVSSSADFGGWYILQFWPCSLLVLHEC